MYRVRWKINHVFVFFAVHRCIALFQEHSLHFAVAVGIFRFGLELGREGTEDNRILRQYDIAVFSGIERVEDIGPELVVPRRLAACDGTHEMGFLPQRQNISHWVI